MGKFGIDGGVNGNTPLFKTGTPQKASVQNNSYDFGFGNEANTTAIGDSFNPSNVPAFNSYDMDQMWAMAGITKPNSIKHLESTMAFAAEGAEYGVEYSEEDMNLARFMFENLKA